MTISEIEVVFRELMKEMKELKTKYEWVQVL